MYYIYIMIIKCSNCEKEINIRPHKVRDHKTNCCSLKCRDILKKKNRTSTLPCNNCSKPVTRDKSAISSSGRRFCNTSCAATYNNIHKTKGNRRSKLEVWIELELTKIYPNLEILYNNKLAISSELDIYIPSIKLGIELNGIFHYEPIYGPEKLDKIKNNDNRKFQACLENKIELCIIDTSSLKYFKPNIAKVFLEIIENIINSSLIRTRT